MKEIDAAEIDLLLTDPPYGVAERTSRFTNKRSALAKANDFPPVFGDDRPFDPLPLLKFHRAVIFGANFFAEKLPPSSSWLVWDKLAGLESKRELGFNDNGDVEFAWTNLGGPARLIPHRWMGAMKGSEHRSKRVHPTQKPIALMKSIIRYWTQKGDVILDPYCGAGSTLIAAKQLRRHSIGIEISEEYCSRAAERLQ